MDQLKRYLEKLSPQSGHSPTVGADQASPCQRLLGAIVGLCQTVAFTHRTRSDSRTQPDSH